MAPTEGRVAKPEIINSY